MTSPLIERIARAMALHRGQDPDLLVAYGSPLRVGHGISVGMMGGEVYVAAAIVPLWRLYEDLAHSAASVFVLHLDETLRA